MKMTTRLTLGLILLMLGQTLQAALINVQIFGNRFEPEVVEIQPGDTVRWQVLEGSHQLLPDNPSLVPGFNSGTLNILQTYSYTFDSLDSEFIYRSSAIDNVSAAVELPVIEQGYPVDNPLSAGWYNMATDGQGMLFEYVPSVNLMTAYWFTFEPETGEQMWLFASGVPDGNRVTMDVIRPQGGKLNDPQAVTRPDWGEITIDFSDCSNAKAWYDGSVDELSGQFPLTRLYLASLCQ